MKRSRFSPDRSQENVRAQLEKERFLFQAVLEQIPIAVWIIEAPTGRVLMHNALGSSFIKQPEKPARSLSEYSGYIAFHQDGRPYLSHEYPGARAMKDGEVVINEEMRIVRQDNTPGYASISAVPVRDQQGNILAAVVIGTDITRFKEAEEALKQSENRYRALFDRAPVGIIEVDPLTRRYIHVNRRFCEMLGYTADQIIGKAIADFTHPSHREIDEDNSNKLMRGELGEVRLEKRYIRKDKSVLWADVSITQVRDRDNRPQRNLAVIIDVTERKKAEEKLNCALTRLQEERAARERFVSTLTHDLRSPLSTVKMSLDLILNRAQDPKSVRTISTHAISGLNRTDQMIQDLLDVTRIKAGMGLSIETSECDLAELAREVRDELSANYRVDFQLEAPKILKGNFSCKQLRRVIENLGSNAAKYGDTSQPILIRLSDAEQGITLSVQNYGNPIPMEELPIIFDSFLRSRTVSKGSRGWGLGLSIVKGVVEAHEGSVSVISNSESGTIFTVTIPKAKESTQKKSA